MHDLTLVKKLSDRKTYTRLSPHIKEWAVSKETWKVLRTVDGYFKSYPAATTINLDEFTTFFMAINKLNAEEHAIYTSYFKKLAEVEDVDSVLLDDVLKNYIVKDYATQILNKVVDVIHDKEGCDIDDVGVLLSTFHKECGSSVTKDDLFVSTSLADTLKACSEKGWEWRMEELNLSAGPIRKGDFIILGARPNTGKTTFCASELSFFASQMETDKRPIIWVNNEEVGTKVMNRVIQAYFGVTLPELLANEEEYSRRYKEEVGNRIRIINENMGMNEVGKLNALFDEENPSMIVFDQLDKVDGFSRDAKSREDLRLGKLYEWGRDLAKKFGPVMAISQASEGADYVNYIPYSMLRGSKTDKAGEADLIITLGRDKEDEYKRYLFVCKNKLWGGARTDPTLRHGKFELIIEPEIARYKGAH